MSYTKQTWNNGETITADKLNHMEDGIAEGGGGGNITFFDLTHDSDNDCYNTTASYNDVIQAMSNGLVLFKYANNSETYTYIVIWCGFGNDRYNVDAIGDSQLVFNAPDATSPLSTCGGLS